jgi:outer membrane protein assembly factor BamB
LALSDGVLYFHDGNSVVHALKASDGTELWRYTSSDLPLSIGFSSPVVAGDYVLVGGSTNQEINSSPPQFQGFVAAIRKSDGVLAWQSFTATGDERGVSVWSTVSVDETLGLVFAGTGNNHGPPAGPRSDAYLALALAGGALRWSQQIFEGDIWMVGVSGPDVDFGANPIVFDSSGKKLVAGGNKGGDFWVLERETGVVIGKRKLGPGSAFKGGIFVSGAWDGTHLLTVCNGATGAEPGSEPVGTLSGTAAMLYALDPLTLDIVWARPVVGPVYSPISVANGVGFFGSDTTLQAIDTDTGEVLKEISTDGTIATAPAISKGYVVFGSGMSWIQATQGTKYYALKVP